MPKDDDKPLVLEMADDLMVGCGWIFVGTLIVIDLFCWIAGWDILATALAAVLIIGFMRGRD